MSVHSPENDLAAALQDALDSATILDRDGQELSPRDLKDSYDSGIFDQDDRLFQARADVPSSKIEPLRRLLRCSFRSVTCPDTDRMGCQMFYTFYEPSPPTMTVSEFSLDLVRASVMIGADRVAHYVDSWSNNSPIQLTRYIALTGMTYEEHLCVDNTIPIIGPVFSSTDRGIVHPSLLRDSPFRRAKPMYKGFKTVSIQSCPLMAIPVSINPSFFHPEGERSEHRIDGLSVRWFRSEDYLQILSLVCNGIIQELAEWSIYGPADAIFSRRSDTSYVKGREIPETTSVSQNEINEAFDIYKSMPDKPSYGRLVNVPLYRWLKSKESNRPLVDRFIDLRVALDSLYVRERAQGEITLRMASAGAMHIGGSAKEKRKTFDRLKKAYGTASGGIHTGVVRETEENKKVLRKAQQICRQSIIKEFHGQEVSPWRQLVFQDD